MKTLLITFSLIFGGITYAQQQQQQQYSRVAIGTSEQSLSEVANLGLAVDHGTFVKGKFVTILSENEIAVLENNNFSYEILIEDIQEYYKKRSLKATQVQEKNATCPTGNEETAPTVPVNFDVDLSYAGFYRYADMLAELDDMAAQYPTLITAKEAIPFPAGGATGEEFTAGETWEGRAIYHVKISDNPSTDEVGEPKVLYTAIHHAREPLSMSQTIFYMWYLLENYGTNPEITYLVDNTQMYFVPCINPDGYIENESNDPSGFGMHRKNKNPNVGTSNPGVDLNRNYSYGWGTTGISWDENSDVYPGAEAFSEPESSAMKYLMEMHNFIAAFNAHTYGELLLHPVGTTSEEYADHHDYFTDLTQHMCSKNGYFPQKSSGLYPASGDSDDYEYKSDIGVGEKDTVFAMTPEIGTDFWPASNEVVPTCQGMVFPNKILAHMSHKYLVVEETDPSMIATATGNFNHAVQRLGVVDGVVNVSIQPLQNILTIGAGIDYDIAIRETATGAISYELVGGLQYEDTIRYVLETDYGVWVNRDTITKLYGEITTQFTDDASTTTNWTGSWNTTTEDSYSPSTSFADSPSSDYGNNDYETYQYNQTIDLTDAVAAQVSFYAKWSVESNYDYCQFQVSTDGGSTWIGQCANYTVTGSDAEWGSVQPDGEPIWEGTQGNWVLEEINLSDYLGQTIEVRFLLETDGGYTEDGFYFDDFTISYNLDEASQPVADFNGPTTACEGDEIQFTDASSGIPDTWEWDFGDGSALSTDENPLHTYTTAGDYTVSLSVTNSEGTDTYSAMITVNEIPELTITSSLANDSTCVNYDVVTFSTTSSTTGSGTISGTGVSSEEFDPSVAGAGTHTISYDYVSSEGCSNFTQMQITVEGCASIDELQSGDVVLFPNPSDGMFELQGLPIGEKYRITDVNGKVVYENIATSAFEQVDLRNVTSGKYFLRMENAAKDVIEIIIAK